MAFNREWEVQNSVRKYPLDDTATTVSDSGVLLPESFIVDANIQAPEIDYATGRKLKYLYLGSAAVTSNLISLTILGSTDPAVPANQGPVGQMESPFIPIASLAVLRGAFVPYRNYPLVPMQPGVMGWVVFGGLENSEDFSLLFSSPTQSMFAPRSAQWYTLEGAKSIRAGSLRTELVGDVEFLFNPPLAADVVTREIEGVGSRKVIEIRLAGDDGTGLPTKERMEAFAGPCHPRPESGTCTREQINTINGVSPNPEGRLILDIHGVNVRRFLDGLCVDSEQGLADACAEIIVSFDDWIHPPFLTTFVDTELNPTMDKFVVNVGYFYVVDPEPGQDPDPGLKVLTGGYESASGGFRIKTIDEEKEETTRTFYMEFEEDELGAAQEMGLYVSAFGGHRVVCVANGDIFIENEITGVRSYLYEAPDPPDPPDPLSPMMITIGEDKTINGITIPNNRWNPLGGTGIVLYGESSNEVTVSLYRVLADA